MRRCIRPSRRTYTRVWYWHRSRRRRHYPGLSGGDERPSGASHDHGEQQPGVPEEVGGEIGERQEPECAHFPREKNIPLRVTTRAMDGSIAHDHASFAPLAFNIERLFFLNADLAPASPRHCREEGVTRTRDSCAFPVEIDGCPCRDVVRSIWIVQFFKVGMYSLS